MYSKFKLLYLLSKRKALYSLNTYEVFCKEADTGKIRCYYNIIMLITLDAIITIITIIKEISRELSHDSKNQENN